MPEELIHQQINAWWKENRANRTPSLLFAYSLGKAQRVLAGLDPEIGPIFVHGAVDAFVRIYRDLGVDLPVVEKADPKLDQDYAGAIILAPPAVEDSNWTRSFRQAKRGFASGWMAIRGARRRKNLDRGFVLSDHADWKGLIEVIKGTGAEEVLMTHGNGDALVRYLSEQGLKAAVLNGASLRGEEEE
jgi:putative mRNA 3-end processing factor